jgi:hypothetical protein
MKIRAGFVSNSSSSSFIFAGFPILKDSYKYLEKFLSKVIPVHYYEKKRKSDLEIYLGFEEIKINDVITNPNMVMSDNYEYELDTSFYWPRAKIKACYNEFNMQFIKASTQMDLIKIFWSFNQKKKFYFARFDDCGEGIELEYEDVYASDYIKYSEH